MLWLIVLIVVLLIAMPWTGYRYGGPYVGGSFGAVLLLILIVVLLRGHL